MVTHPRKLLKLYLLAFQWGSGQQAGGHCAMDLSTIFVRLNIWLTFQEVLKSHLLPIWGTLLLYPMSKSKQESPIAFSPNNFSHYWHLQQLKFFSRGLGWEVREAACKRKFLSWLTASSDKTGHRGRNNTSSGSLLGFRLAWNYSAQS